MKATLEGAHAAFNMGLFFNGSINYTNPDAVQHRQFCNLVPAQIQGSAAVRRHQRRRA